MAQKRTKVDRLERQTEQLGKRVDRHPDEIEKEPSTLVPKSDEPTVLIPMEQQIQQRAYEVYEQRGRTDGYDLDDWLQAESEIKGQAGESSNGIATLRMTLGHALKLVRHHFVRPLWLSNRSSVGNKFGKHGLDVQDGRTIQGIQTLHR
jgi:hypothetical protein